MPDHVTTSTPKRVQLRRAKGWRKPDNTIVVARPSRWGNPFSIEALGRRRSVDMYRTMVFGMWDPPALADLRDWEVSLIYEAHQAWRKRIGGRPAEVARYQLSGINLACWCPLDRPCHADVLLELANA